MAIHGGASSWFPVVCLLLRIALQLQGAGAAEKLVPAMFVFGDSMLDVGNNNFIKNCDVGCLADYPHFGVDYLDHAPTGRFSNGYNMADHLAQLLGFDESPPPFLSLSNASLISRMRTGINFASGGSGLLPDTGKAVCQRVLPMTEQVGNFTNLARSWASGNNSRSCADLLSKSLFFISAGSNDLFEYTDLTPQNNDTELLQGLVASYAAYLKDLYGAGARKFCVLGTSLLGCCPSQRAIAHNVSAPKELDKYQCYAAPNNLSRQLYPMFDGMLKDLSGKLPGMNYSLVESVKMADLVLGSPIASAVYNLTVLDTACCGEDQFGASGCNFSAPLCPNRNNYLFWDDYHPTDAAAQIAAQIIFSDNGSFVHPINVQQLVGPGGGAAIVENI